MSSSIENIDWKAKYEEKVAEYSVLQKQLSEMKGEEKKSSKKKKSDKEKRKEKETKSQDLALYSADFNWLSLVPNQSVRAEFQVFISQLHAFSESFRTRKYTPYFHRMSDPLDFFFQQIIAPYPPEDVLVAQLSGIAKTALSEIRSSKSGRRRSYEFLRMSQKTSTALEKFVNSLQAAIRSYHLEEEKGNDENATHINKSIDMRTSLLKIESVEATKKKIAELKLPPRPATFCENISRTLTHSSKRIFLAMIAWGLAGGNLSCSVWYHIDHARSFWFVLPIILILFGLILVFHGYCQVKHPSDKGFCSLFRKNQSKTKVTALLIENENSEERDIEEH